MNHRHYFPGAITAQRAWLVNYKAKIATYGPLLGLTAAQITTEQNLCQTLIDEIDATDAVLVAATAKVTERDTMIRNQMVAIRAGITTKKKNSGYTPAIGEALDVIGSEIVVDTLTVKTTVKVAKTPQGVEIKFGLEQCEGGNVYCKRGTETEFTFLKYITHPHTIDTRPNIEGATTEKRQYYVILVINDIEVGIASAPETITV